MSDTHLKITDQEEEILRLQSEISTCVKIQTHVNVSGIFSLPSNINPHLEKDLRVIEKGAISQICNDLDNIISANRMRVAQLLNSSIQK